MSRYHFAPRPLSDGLVLPRAPAGRHHSTDVAKLSTPLQTAVSPYTSIKAEGPSAPFHDQFNVAGDALLSLTGEKSTALQAGKKMSLASDEGLNSPVTDVKTCKRKRVDPSKLRRREQCRANQARYRDKQRNAQMQLEKSVELLHKELETLKRECRDLSSRERSNQSPWSIVAEVFRLLESSFRHPWRVVDSHEMAKHPVTRHILAVLERSFAHDAALGDLRGVDVLMEQIRLYSQCFGNPQLQLERMETMAPAVMAAHATLSVTVTEFTLRHLFPHLEQPTNGVNGEGGCGVLYRCLLDRRLDCNCSLNFLFDEDSDRVVRLETTINFVSPLLRLLGDLKRVAAVLERAQISSEWVIGCKGAVSDGCSGETE